MANKHKGSSLDSFLEEEGILAQTESIAIKEVIAWQISEEMKKRHISKRAMAIMMKTSRTQVDRVLDPQNGNVTLDTLQKAAQAIGKSIQISFV